MTALQGMDIEAMGTADIGAVVAIDNLSQPSPWTAELFARELEHPWAYVDVVRIIGEHGPRVLGFCNYWLVADEIQLHNLAIHPDYRRRGLGRALLVRLLAFAHARACVLVTLEVRASNEPALALYRAHGFQAVARRGRYYTDNGEDAVIMHLGLDLDLQPPPEPGTATGVGAGTGVGAATATGVGAGTATGVGAGTGTATGAGTATATGTGAATGKPQPEPELAAGRADALSKLTGSGIDA